MPRFRPIPRVPRGLLLALPLLLPVARGPLSAQESSPPTDATLEGLLRRARAQERALLQRLQEPTRFVVEGLEAAKGADEFERARGELEGLGPEAAPLLVVHLDPGEDATSAQVRRARAVADALRAWGAPGIADEVVALALGPSKRARQQAARVLPFLPDRAEGRRVLLELLGRPDADARLDAARGLVELVRADDLESVPPLRQLLVDEQVELVAEALNGLAAVGDRDSAAEIARLASSPTRALSLLEPLRAYFEASPRLPRLEVTKALVQSATQTTVISNRRALLELAATLDTPWNRELEDLFEPLLELGDPEVADEARIAMARLGDRGARRDLLRKYDDWVKRRSNFPSAYEERARIQLRVGDYGEAGKDYETAVALYSARGNDPPRELYIELARARCLDGKLKQANTALQNAYPSSERLRRLAQDPDFAALVEHGRYGRQFVD